MSSVKKWEDRMPAPRWEKRCDMNCSPCTNDCDDCRMTQVYGDAIAARDAEIAEYRAIQAAPEATSEQTGGAQVARGSHDAE